MTKKKVIIIGAGPAGLTAAYEMLNNTDIIPVIFEAADKVGGLSKTIKFKGNLIDIGGHRYYSNLPVILKWWSNILPFERSINDNYPNPDETNLIMLRRPRNSKILYKGKYFDYPIKLNFETFLKFGIIQIVQVALSYFYIKIVPKRNEKYLDNFLINRFGEKLYKMFFRDYSKKVWGVPPDKINAGWGSQRMKGLSIRTAVVHYIENLFFKKNNNKRKNTNQSLIGQFLYPKLGAGQIWEETARIIEEQGVKINTQKKVTKIIWSKKKVTGVQIYNLCEHKFENYFADYVISTMPIKDLINSMDKNVPRLVNQTANGLSYRGIIIVGLLLDKNVINRNSKLSNILKNTWVYIQENELKVGRIQVLNNWSPYMVKSPDTVLLGLEYFCNKDDHFWRKNDKEIIDFAINEFQRLIEISTNDIIDNKILREPYAYPCYFGTYERFPIIREFTDSIENLFLIGRNGMHAYINCDYAMLTAIKVVENIKRGIKKKDNIWELIQS